MIKTYVDAVAELHEITVVLLLLILVEVIGPQLSPEGSVPVNVMVPVNP